MASKQKAARRRPFILGTAACHDFLIFSSILKMPFGAPTNMRLKVLGRQRRSSVLRRGGGGSGPPEFFPKKRGAAGPKRTPTYNKTREGGPPPPARKRVPQTPNHQHRPPHTAP